jgi:hypothetical protein
VKLDRTACATCARTASLCGGSSSGTAELIDSNQRKPPAPYRGASTIVNMTHIARSLPALGCCRRMCARKSPVPHFQTIPIDPNYTCEIERQI